VLIEEVEDVASEKYIAFLLDRKSGLPRLFASSIAGVGVESAGPAVFPLPPGRGGDTLDRGLIGSVLAAMEMPHKLEEEPARMIRRLADFFFTRECLMLEINPLAVTVEGRLVALDAKIEFDDHALFRHPDLQPLRDLEQEGAVTLGPSGMPAVLLGGDVGVLANGAGLGLAVMDGLAGRGGAAANFLDIGGAASAGDVRRAVEWMLQNERIRSILVHIFGGIVRCDLVAEGMLSALLSSTVRKPVAVRFAGTNSGRGLDLLRESGMDFIFAGSLGEALDAAVGSGASGNPG
jgi:succinyl-CoA synthetase beta subunit